MGWVYLDDKFPEHPKVNAAGGDASWLFICGLGYVNRNGTNGLIPKVIVSRLSDRKNSAALARRLVAVKLWHDVGDSYEVNDYEQWNRSAIDRRAKAKKAAEARWRPPPRDAPPDAPGNASSNAQASPEHMHQAMLNSAQAYAFPQVTQVPQSSSGATDAHDGISSNPDDDDGQKLAKAAIRVLAVRHLDRRQIEKGPVDQPERWLTTAVGRLATEHRTTIQTLDLTTFATVEALADHLEPARQTTSPVDKRSAADRANQARADEPPCPECGRRGCGGSVYPNGPDGGTIPCPRWKKRLRSVS